MIPGARTHENSVPDKCISSPETCVSGSDTCVSGRGFLLNHPPGGRQGVVDSDPPCPWRANEERESLLIVPAWAADSEIGAPWEEAPLFGSMFTSPRSGGLRSAMPMGSQRRERIAFHCPRMGRRFRDRRSLLGEQALDPWGFIIHVRSHLELRHEWIPSEVARDIHQMIPISDQPVEIILLPDWSFTTSRPVDLRGSEAFPTGDSLPEINGLAQRE